MRTVTVFAMNTNQRRSIDTGARTWGEVKSADSGIRGMVTSDMKIVIKQTKAVIESDDTVLPDNDITIYLFPGKVKSGASPSRAYEKEAANISERLVSQFFEALKKDAKETDRIIKLCEGKRAKQGSPTPF